MNFRENLPPEPRRPITGYLWGALAVLTCPCHLPILAAALAGTTAGGTAGHQGRPDPALHIQQYRPLHHPATARPGQPPELRSATLLPALSRQHPRRR